MLDTRVAQGSTVPGSKKDIGEDDTLTETSTFSEITLTDESDEEMSHGKVFIGFYCMPPIVFTLSVFR